MLLYPRGTCLYATAHLMYKKCPSVFPLVPRVLSNDEKLHVFMTTKFDMDQEKIEVKSTSLIESTHDLSDAFW